MRIAYVIALTIIIGIMMLSQSPKTEKPAECIYHYDNTIYVWEKIDG